MVPMLILFYFGNYCLLALCLFVGFVGTREFFKGFNAMGVKPSFPIAIAAMAALYVLNLFFPNDFLFMVVWFIGVIIVCSLLMFNVEKHTPMDAMATMVGIIYIIFFSFMVLQVDQMGMFRILKWTILLSAFGSDICAYFTGVFLGKHKMCPKLSPKKTWEGAIGGVVGSTVVCALFGLIFARHLLISCIIIGAGGAIISMCGDLTASAYKRKMGIKDYGNLIPGHGGIMDRFDSVLFTAPFVFCYIIIVLRHVPVLF